MRRTAADAQSPSESGERAWKDAILSALEAHRFELATEPLRDASGAPIRTEAMLMLRIAADQDHGHLSFIGQPEGQLQVSFRRPAARGRPGAGVDRDKGRRVAAGLFPEPCPRRFMRLGRDREPGPRRVSGDGRLRRQFPVVVQDVLALRLVVADGSRQQRAAAVPVEAVDGARAGALVVDMSTISPVVSRDTVEKVRARGADMVDSPVSGSISTLEQGKLTMMVGGKAETFEKVKPILLDIGMKATHVGDNGLALSMKPPAEGEGRP